MEDGGPQARFRAMADSVPVLLWLTGTGGACTFLNRRWLEFTRRELERRGQLAMRRLSHIRRRSPLSYTQFTEQD